MPFEFQSPSPSPFEHQPSTTPTSTTDELPTQSETRAPRPTKPTPGI
jgi:hypothetical protein